jgi:tetratricopeptide (TPR) repeat protein
LRPRIQDAEKVIRDVPANDAADKARYQLAIVQLLMGKYDKSIELLERVRTPDGKCLATLHFLRGKKLYDARRLLEAKAELDKAIELDTNNAWAYEYRTFIAGNLDEPSAPGYSERWQELEPDIEGLRRTLPWWTAPPVCVEIRDLTHVVQIPIPKEDEL